ncbi:MAG: ATP-binding protein, partial [Candidatus Eremiobacteraeota bacterium]|nr:ATP-binding protein [Candidatus Eremiobacteraeota bacterium]
MARAVGASDALETLIAQFSQPLAFLRELIQNALDASTNRVDVEIRRDKAEGCAVIEVIDTGEGMD